MARTLTLTPAAWRAIPAPRCGHVSRPIPGCERLAQDGDRQVRGVAIGNVVTVNAVLEGLTADDDLGLAGAAEIALAGRACAELACAQADPHTRAHGVELSRSSAHLERLALDRALVVRSSVARHPTPPLASPLRLAGNDGDDGDDDVLVARHAREARDAHHQR
jgi:hypothetical protein